MAHALQRLALDHYLMAHRIIDQPRFDRIGDGMIPFGLDVGERRTHADAVNFGIGGDGADHDGYVVCPAQAIDDVCKQESLARGLVDATDKLPAHQRMHFCIFVDRPVDPL